ncbi:MAG: glycosyltransferase 87 family protein [Gemmatimonadales bacterium]
MAIASEVKGGLIAAGIALAVGAFALNETIVGVFYDDGLYAGLASALASGMGYVHPHLPGTPAAVHYPPLYPLVLTPLFGLFSVTTAGFIGKVINLLLSAGGAGLIAWHATRTGLIDPVAPRWSAPAIVAAAAIAIPTLATQSVLFAEPLFGLLLACAVVAADRGDRPWIVGGAAALALLTRSIGIAAAAGIACFLFTRVSRKALLTAMIPVLVAGAAWGLWVGAHARAVDPWLATTYGSYGAVLRQTGLSALGVSARDLARPLEAITLGWIPIPWLFVIAATAALGVGLYGLVLLSRRSAIGFTLVCYLLILAIWPYPADRFLWAVLPWLGLAWAMGAVALWRRPRLRVPVGSLGALLVIGFAQYEIRGLSGRWWETQARAISANFTELLPVIAELPADAVVAVDDEALVWLHTRRRAVPFYLERYRGRDVLRPTAAEHRDYLERMSVTHVVLASASSPSAVELRSLIEAYPGLLTAVYRWPGGRWLFEVHRGQ